VSEALFQAAFDRAIEFMGILEPNGTVVEVNQTALDFRGLARSEVIGRPFWETPWWDTSPEARERLRQAVADAADGEQVHHEVIHRALDGTARTFDFSLQPISDRQGARLLLAEGRDVTKRVRAETEQATLLRQVQAAEAKFRGLVESAPDAIVMTRLDGTIVLVNRQAELLFGYGRDELLGQSVELLVPERFRGPHITHRLRYAEAPRTRPMGSGLELSARHQDGSEIAVAINLSPVEAGDELLVTSIIRDVTDQKSLERQKDEFLSNVSHDLRTPLAGIKASIGVVLANEPPDTPEPLHRLLVNIDLAADRMANLVSDLLELTRLRSGRAQLRLGQCDLRALALRCIRVIEPLVRERDQQVRVHLPPGSIVTLADGDRLERALLNLLGNAHKYGRDGGRVELALEVWDARARFAVTDDGPGISASEQGRIFERFYRSEAESTQRNEGSGLGLPIARALVELHGGKIGVKSAPGAGATFWIELPLVDPDAVLAEESLR
jgi:protein-histidine pros-kinase